MNIRYHLYDFYGLNIHIFNSLIYYSKNDILNKIADIISILFCPILFSLYLTGIFFFYILFLKLSYKSYEKLYQNFYKFWQYFSNILVSYTMMSILVVLIKSFTSFQRPNNGSFDSFPSGHSSLAMMLHISFIREFISKSIKRKRNTIILNFLSILIVLIVGLSRIIRQNHYPSDVLYGYIITTITSIISIYATKYLSKVLNTVGYTLFNFFFKFF